MKDYAFKVGCRNVSRLITGNALDTWAFEHGVQIEFTVQGSPQIMDTLKALTENSEMSA